ncbi:MAG TPA: DOMON-like domain-containing protein [Rhizomicrobium sp.]|nr:DOMON-like domain-containing protein [Rhizomicrobium sp.]
MPHPLKLHPDCRCDAVREIAVEATRPEPAALRLRYRVSGAVAGLLVPAPASPSRTDGLWQHTCFEAFLRAGAGESYYEYNFAPSTEWAAYAFTSYRSEMRIIADAALSIELTQSETALDLTAEIHDLPAETPWRVALSAVMEERNGRRSYWALAHPKGKPDFHHSDCFALELP